MQEYAIRAARISFAKPIPNKEGRIFHMENRAENGIAIASTGSYIYRQEEKNFLADRNHVILLPRGSTYTLYCYESDIAYVVNFEGDIPDGGLRTFPVDAPRAEELYRTAAKLSQTFQQSYSSVFSAPDPYRSLSVFYELLSILFAPPEPELFLLPDDPLFRAVQFLDEHFADPELRIETLSDLAGVSVSWFRKRFNSIVGTSPCTYLMNLRISHAKSLLCDDTLSIGNIAAKCGYSDVYAFSAAFKKYTGIAPSAYRKRIRAM